MALIGQQKVLFIKFQLQILSDPQKETVLKLVLTLRFQIKSITAQIQFNQSL